MEWLEIVEAPFNSRRSRHAVAVPRYYTEKVLDNRLSLTKIVLSQELLMHLYPHVPFKNGGRVTTGFSAKHKAKDISPRK